MCCPQSIFAVKTAYYGVGERFFSLRFRMPVCFYCVDYEIVVRCSDAVVSKMSRFVNTYCVYSKKVVFLHTEKITLDVLLFASNDAMWIVAYNVKKS